MEKNKEFDKTYSLNSSELSESLQENEDEQDKEFNLKIIDLAPLKVSQLIDSCKGKGFQIENIGLGNQHQEEDIPHFETVKELIEFVRQREEKEMSNTGGSSSNKLGSSYGSQQGKCKGSKNKRNSADHTPQAPINSPSSLVEFPQYESSSAKSANPQINLATQGPQPSSMWEDPFARQLECLLMVNIQTVFEKAIKQLVDCGYAEDVAKRAINRKGGGGKNIVANIVNDALDLLKSGMDLDSAKDIKFENLKQMVEYIMLELVNVIVQVKPKLSIGEAMWWFLLFDMDIVQACGVEGYNLLSQLHGKEISEQSSSDVELSSRAQISQNIPPSHAQSSLHQPLKFGSFTSAINLKNSEQPTSQKSAAVGEKLSIKGSKSVKEKDLETLQKALQSISKSGKSSTLKSKGKMEASTTDGSSHVPSSAPSAISVSKDSSKSSASAGASAQAPVSAKKPPSKPEASTTEIPKTSDYCAGIPYDKSLGKYVPQDTKDELILQLVSRVEGLQNDVQSWNDWANRKVMEVTTRLSKDRLELKALKQEKEEAEQLKKEKKMLEETAQKGISLANATCQVEAANDIIIKLEAERNMLWDEMEASKLRAVETAVNSEEALEKEQKNLKDAQSMKGQKSLLQEELENQKQKVVQLQQKISKAEKIQNQIEAKLKQEAADREDLNNQAAFLKYEQEQLEAAIKAEEDMMKLEAEKDMEKCNEDIKMLEEKKSELKFKSEASRIAALKRGMDGNYCMTDNPGADFSLIGSQEAGNFPGIFGAKILKRERECVMCLSEEGTVVFLPCAHEVLCKGCNELHEQQGMKDCPSCRTPIYQRILVRFAHT